MSQATSKENKGPISWMAGHSVAANLIMVACLLGGYMFMMNMKQEVFPDFEIDAVNVSVDYPGASPEEVESGIVLVIEEAVSGLDGVDVVRSKAAEGVGSVTVEALVGTDIQKLTQDIQSEIDRIVTFPEEAEKPQVSAVTMKRKVISVVLYGNAEERVLHELIEQLRDRLLQDPGITQIDLSGVRPLEISIEVSQENLRRYNLTLDEIANRLRNASLDMPGGSIKTDAGEVLLRMKERRDFGREFARLPIITTSDGSELLLEDIARITDGFQDTDYYATYNGKPAVMANIYRVGDQTPIQVSEKVRSYLKQVEDELPLGVHVEVLEDQSEIYSQRVNMLLRNSALGLVLVMVALALFLEARLAFWVMMGIPISFLGAFLFLPALGLSINMISLFAFIIALGIVVDDAIVVGENVYHYRQHGMPALKAAVKGAREMAMPVTFSILTNIATFLPLYFMPGTMGKVFQMIPLVVVTVFLVSLAESLFVLPAHLARINVGQQRHGISALMHNFQQCFSHAFKDWVRNRYGSFLDTALEHRYLTVAIAFSFLFIVISYALSGRMGMETIPKTESDFSRATLTMPYGTALKNTQESVNRLLASARKVADETGQADVLVKGIFTEVGKEGAHHAQMTVYLAEPDIRDHILSTEAFTRQWRKSVGEIAGIDSLLFESDAGGPGHGRAVTVELNHRELDVLEQASSQLAESMKAYPLVKDVDDGFTPGKQQLDFTILPEGRSLALAAQNVANQVRDAYYGAEVLRQQRGRNEIRVMVRQPESQRASEHNIDELMIRTSSGTYVPLREIVNVERGRAYTEINRRNGRRVVQVEADVTPRSKGGEVLNDIKDTELPRLQQQFPGLQYSFEGQQAEMTESLSSLKVTFVLALLAIFAMLAIPFQSYIQPLIVLVSIPFGIIGAIIGHLIMGYDLSIVSMLGIVALAGVVVNDSLVLINYANRLTRKSGLTPREVIKVSAIQRFRPILLTTLTTFGGLMPMILETSRQARILIPMAISLGFGVVFATFITLVLIPSLYLVVDDIRKLAGRG